MIDANPETLAALAYDAYGGTTDHKNYQGNPMPAWADLPPKIKAAWIAATKAIVASGANVTLPSVDGFVAVGNPFGPTGIR